jgi:lipopolysaccharide export system protein LptC
MTRTRVVRWLRVLLPLAALAMLSTMFLFGRQSDSESRIPYATVDAEAAARDGRIVAPRYDGVTRDGVALSLRAAQAAPAQEGGAARDLRLDWRRPDGLQAALTAPRGAMAGEQLTLEGGVTMTTSSGWQVRASRIAASTETSVITAEDGIEAEAPFGQIEAGRMRLAPAGQDPGSPAILDFSGGVRLVYRP